MSDHYFRELLGVKPEAGIDEIKRAFHRLARENHPDIFPEERKELQELKMMALNEAYDYLLAFCADRSDGKEKPQAPPAAPVGKLRRRAAPKKELGFHKDPSYAYYKQGFVHFSRALHGIEALYQSMAKKELSFKPRYYSYQRFAGSLGLLRKSYEYFSRVVDEYPESIWWRDAQIKLERIERFSALYRKILANIKD